MSVTTPTEWTEARVAAAAAMLEEASAEDIVRWAVEQFGERLCLTTSMTDAVVIDLAVRVSPRIDVVFLDTQYHFPETLDMVATVQDRYGITVRVLAPDFEPDDLWRIDTELCCKRRKVDQLDRALSGVDAWMSGLRRIDTPERADTPVVALDRRGLVKISPLARWTDADVEAYVAANDVPCNPLIAQGFPSIGCWPCTRAVADGEDPRAGRWADSDKTECGLHL